VVGSVAASSFAFTFTGNCKSITLTNVGFSSSITTNAASNLFNFPKAAIVNLVNTELPGLLLAPLSSVGSTRAAVNGQVIANSLSGDAQIRNNPFIGCIKADLSGACPNTCSGGALDLNTCLCQNCAPCGDNKVLIPGTCQCACNVQCPLGQQANDACGCDPCPAAPTGSLYYVSDTPCSYIAPATGKLSSSPFHVAKDYSVFVLGGGFTGRNNHVGGRIAANGNVDLLNFLVADEVSDAPNTCTSPSVVASGKIVFPNNGRIATGYVSAVSGDVSQVSVCPLQTAAAINFAQASTCINLISNKLFSLDATGDASIQKGDNNVFRFVGSGSNPEVFNVDVKKDKPFSAGYWALEGVAAGATIIVNFDGQLSSGDGFSNMDMSEFEGVSTHTIFNFNTNNLSVYGVAVQGSILAPNALVTASNGRIVGQLVANNVAAPLSGTNGVYVQWLGGFSGSLGSSIDSFISSKNCAV